MSALVAILALASGPQPVSGPALPITFLRSQRPFKISVGKSWAHGVYDVSFEFRASESVASVGKKIAADGFRDRNWGTPITRQYNAERCKDGIFQSIEAFRPVLEYVGNGPKGHYSGSKEQPYTGIWVHESLAPHSAPARWFKGAIAPTPPVPLIDIPFLQNEQCDAVGLTSFDGLMSSKGIRYEGVDAQVFTRTINRPLREIEAALVKWAEVNGYSRTPMGSYFKPHTRLFEIQVRSASPATECSVTAYATGRDASHPIVWEKF